MAGHDEGPAVWAARLGASYGMTWASYDLVWVARNGLTASTYDLTPDRLAFAIFCAKVRDRVVTPLFAACQPQAPPELLPALQENEHVIHVRPSAGGRFCGAPVVRITVIR